MKGVMIFGGLVITILGILAFILIPTHLAVNTTEALIWGSIAVILGILVLIAGLFTDRLTNNPKSKK